GAQGVHHPLLRRCCRGIVRVLPAPARSGAAGGWLPPTELSGGASRGPAPHHFGLEPFGSAGCVLECGPVIRNESLYPDYDVLALLDEWEANTREGVAERWGRFEFKLLSPGQQDMVKTLARQLAWENRDEVLSGIVAHLDAELRSREGEAQRKPGIPAQ